MTRRPRVAVVVPCSKEKAWDAWPALGPLPAAQAYTSPLHRACQARAVALNAAQGWPWFVLSARYGLLRPADLIPDTYDVTFSRPDDPVIDDAALAKQLERFGLMVCDRLLVFCPDDYTDRLRHAVRLHHAARWAHAARDDLRAAPVEVVPVFAGVPLDALGQMTEVATRVDVAS